MKRFTQGLMFFLLFAGVTEKLSAQGGALGMYTTVSEYDGDLSGNKHHFYGFDHSKFGAGISLAQYLNRSFNLVEMATYNRLEYQNTGKTQGVGANFGTLNVNLRYKFNNGYIFKETAAISPFLTAGIGATYIDSKQFITGSDAKITDGQVKANVNAGAGILFQFNDRVGIEFANTIQMPLYDAWDGVSKGHNDVYLQHSLGLIFNLKKPLDTDRDGVPDKKDKCPDTPGGVTVDTKGCPIDTDLDGVADYLDKCASLPGLVELNGCPDKDKDGVADGDDKCPDVAGISRFQGCPDSDGDGIEDSQDKCPNEKGTDQFKGCPDTDGDGVEDATDKCPNTPAGTKVDETGCVADSDADGVIDTEDACPNIAGTATNKGCPEVKAEVKQLFAKALQGIQFESGKAVIKPVSFPILNSIKNVMDENPSYKLVIGGYTDDIGDDAMNLTLSQNRADAVANYLIGKGVDPLRVSGKGFGEASPVDTNKTAAGRARNRRVDLKVEFLDTVKP